MKKGLGRNPGSCGRWIRGQRGKGFLSKIQRTVQGDFPGVQRLRLWAPNAGGLGCIPGQGTSFHMLQLRVGTIKDINTFKRKRKKKTVEVTTEVKVRFGISLVLNFCQTS